MKPSVGKQQQYIHPDLDILDVGGSDIITASVTSQKEEGYQGDFFFDEDDTPIQPLFFE